MMINHAARLLLGVGIPGLLGQPLPRRHPLYVLIGYIKDPLPVPPTKYIGAYRRATGRIGEGLGGNVSPHVISIVNHR